MKPILFNTEMVRAILDGHKTQTRRVIKPQPEVIVGDKSTLSDICMAKTRLNAKYQAGDICYILEPYRIDSSITVGAREIIEGMYLLDKEPFSVSLSIDASVKFRNRKFPYRKTPARFMYKELARHSLEVTSVRVERVQDIMGADAVAEGIPPFAPDGTPRVSTIPRKQFAVLWDSINSKRGYGWEVNPWVYVYEFTVTAGKGKA